MRTLAIINQKGGCGKTTAAINLAAVLARRGHRTLLVDLDPQSHCALGLAVPEAQVTRSMADVMRAGLDGSVGLDDIIWQVSRGLDLAPSTMSLAAVEQHLAGAPDKDRRLSQVLATVQERYQWCVIDCPPSIGLLTFNALRAAREVIVPVETGYFALHGSVKQEQTIDMLARRVGHEIVFRVLPTMYDVRTKLAREILAELKKRFGDRLMPMVINFNAKLKEAASFGQPITEYDPASRGMADFDELAEHLLAHPPRPVVSASAEALRPTSAQHPAMSRAAELVERARALAGRASQLADGIRHDPDASQEGVTPAPQADPTPAPAPAPAPMPQPEFATEPLGIHAPRRPHPSLETVDQTPSAEPEPEPAAPPKGDLQQRLAKLYGVRRTSHGLLFVQPANGAMRVCLAGDFNGWDPNRTPMRRDERLNIWQACLDLPPGRYRYRLVADGAWIADPYNQATEVNAYGEKDNVIEIAG